MSLFLGWLLSLFQTQIKKLKNVSLTLKGAQKLPNLHSSQKCWHDIYYNKKNPQNVAWIYPYFYKCIFPTLEHSNNHSKWWVSNTNINIQLTYILSKLFAAYIPQIVVFNTNSYSPTVYPKGAQKLQQHIQPPSVGLIYPIPTCVQLTFIPQIVGCIYPITYLYFKKCEFPPFLTFCLSFFVSVCVCVCGERGWGGTPITKHPPPPYTPHVEDVMMKVENYVLWFTQHFHFFNGWSWFEWSSQQNPNTYILEMKLHLFLVLKMK